jgi:arsenate reductase
MPERPYNVLFLCTGNTARSVLAEGILRKDGAGRFNAFAAGSQLKGVINPFALKVLRSFEYPSEGYRSKSWDEFAGPDAPVMDFIFTVCDSAAGETCPIWPGHPASAHWGIEDPAAAQGPDIEKEKAFVQAFKYLKNRISAFLALPMASLDQIALTHHLNEIGRLEGATPTTVFPFARRQA